MQIFPLQGCRRLRASKFGARIAATHVDTEWKTPDRLCRARVDAADLGLAFAPAGDCALDCGRGVEPGYGPQHDENDRQHRHGPRPPSPPQIHRFGVHRHLGKSNAVGKGCRPIKPANAAFRRIEHDPEKWKPVFGKDHAQTKKAVFRRFSSLSSGCMISSTLLREPPLLDHNRTWMQISTTLPKISGYSAMAR